MEYLSLGYLEGFLGILILVFFGLKTHYFALIIVIVSFINVTFKICIVYFSVELITIGKLELQSKQDNDQSKYKWAFEKTE